MRYLLLALTAIVLAPHCDPVKDVAATPSAAAPCGKRSDLMTYLADRFAEEPIARGETKDGSVIELLTSKDGTSFTIIRTTADGTSCLIATGSDWESVKQRLEDLGA